jgi:hypothetical protein
MHLLGVVAALLALGVATEGCKTYRDELARGRTAFDANDHVRTLAILRDLEPDVKRLEPAEQAQYAYLRGMTDYRAGYRADARHWLSVAKALEETSPGGLPGDWKQQTTEALGVLNDVVYMQGTAALATPKVASEDDGKTASPAAAKEPGRETKKSSPNKEDAPSSPPPSDAAPPQ